MKREINYKIRWTNTAERLIHIEIGVSSIDTNELEICLPVWRPGRYELGNFAKNIYQFEVFSHNEEPLSFYKKLSHCWVVNTEGYSDIRIVYSYYAAELNAGSSYISTSQLYVNPVNCCLYIPDRMDDLCLVTLDIPKHWKVAGSLKPTETDHIYKASGFDELADSPLIAAAELQHQSFVESDCLFHIWFCGDVQPDWEKMLSDFKKIINNQILMMGPLPVSEYHFLFQVLPQPFYHGVEHLSSTVCALGPGYKLFGPELYKELLGVSSHELFHVWNVKTIRPKEMLPYKFDSENYSRMGWIYEGITSYYGDQFLIRSGIFSVNDFLSTLNDKLKKHFSFYGRFNQSVADASFDTWLDGYTLGIPHRKTSIYTEGSIAAFIFDMKIRAQNQDRFSLDDFMRRLMHISSDKQGYDRKIVIDLLSNLLDSEAEALYRQLVEEAEETETWVREAGKRIGLVLETTENYSPIEHTYGFLLAEGTYDLVKLVAPGSPASKAGLLSGDTIVAINGWRNRQQLVGRNYLFDSKLSLHVFSDEAIREIEMLPDGQKYFQSRAFTFSQNVRTAEARAWESWSGVKHPFSIE